MPKKYKITIPDYISFSRFIGGPILLVLIIRGYFIFAFILYAIFALTDAIDGFVARLLTQKTRFGGMLDALADRVFLIFVILALLIINSIPLWSVIILICYLFIEVYIGIRIMYKFRIKNYLYFIHRDSICTVP